MNNIRVNSLYAKMSSDALGTILNKCTDFKMGKGQDTYCFCYDFWALLDL